MRKVISKLIVIFFVFGTILPFNSFILDNFKKNSITYSYLCKFDQESKSEKNSSQENCFYCIQNEVNDSTSFSSIDTYDNFGNIVIFANFLDFHSQNNFRKSRSPPFTS